MTFKCRLPQIMRACIFTLKVRRRVGGMYSGMPHAPARLSCEVAHLPSGAAHGGFVRSSVYDLMITFHQLSHTIFCAGSQPKLILGTLQMAFFFALSSCEISAIAEKCVNAEKFTTHTYPSGSARAYLSWI